MFSKVCLTKQIELYGSKNPRARGNVDSSHSAGQTVSHCSKHSSGRERRAMSMAGLKRREMPMNISMKALLAAGGALAVGIGAATTPAHAQGKTITLCWAAWDPANALVELSKDFTAKTGIGMKFEFVPWTNYADRFLNELNSRGSLCDLLIGDS